MTFSSCRGGSGAEPDYFVEPDAGAPSPCVGSTRGGPIDCDSTVFLRDQEPVKQLFADETYLYWKSEGSEDNLGNRVSGPLMRMSLADETPEAIEGFEDAIAFQQNATHLYWIEYDADAKRIYRAPKSDLTAQSLVLESSMLDVFSVNDSSLFWLEPPNTETRRIFISSVDGTGQTDLLASLPPYASTFVDNTHLYWNDENTLHRAPLGDTSSIETISNSTFDPEFLAVDASILYSIEGDEAYSVVARNTESGESLNIARHECLNRRAQIGENHGHLFCEDSGGSSSPREWELFSFLKSPAEPIHQLTTEPTRVIIGPVEANGELWWAQNGGAPLERGSLHRLSID